jgi:hypothetical protein
VAEKEVILSDAKPTHLLPMREEHQLGLWDE